MSDTGVLGIELLAGAERICVVGLDLSEADPSVARLRAIAPNASVSSLPRDPAGALVAVRGLDADVLILAQDARKLTAIALLSGADRILLYKGGRLSVVTPAGFLARRAPVMAVEHAARQAVERAQLLSAVADAHQHFYVVSCGRNAGRTALRCLSSVYEQRYPRDRITHLYVDDASTDDTRVHVQAWLGTHPRHRVTYVQTGVRAGGTKNTLRAFRDAPPGSIVVEVNGDDWLYDDGVFAHLDKIYADPAVWMTYNSSVFADGSHRAHNRPYDESTIRDASYRRDDWYAGHLRTFRAELFAYVSDEELIDPATGTWWESADDMVIYMALLEMSGSHARHVDRPTYVYNHRDASEDVRDLDGGRLRGERIRAMAAHDPLATLDPIASDDGPLVSVLMPVYDAGPYLETAMRCVLDQSYRNLELVVVNDGSTDDSPAIMRRLADGDDRIRILDQDNQGLVVSLNRAVAAATGPLLARMDGDDTCRPDRLARQVAFLGANPDVGAVGSWAARIDETGRSLGQVWETPASPGAIGWYLCFENCLPHGSVTMRKTVVDRAGGYDPAARHAEDYDLWIRLDAITKLANLPEPLMGLRVHGGRVGVRHDDEQHRTLRRLMAARGRTYLPDVPEEIWAALFSLHRRRFEHPPGDPSAVLDALLDLRNAYASSRRLLESEREHVDYDVAKKLLRLATWCASTHPLTATRAVTNATRLDPSGLARRGWRALRIG